ncbi:NAD-dependent epimerase/dehydratase family protein [Pseudomonas sp. EA_65y_Pfl2_P74]|uniref:NAD-dependent epimerase/dehydratase family protein n=1 Tax=Pseudomonas sp. EA_65y_Pfl2_P74 TaxID=3088694 RepID=UPI0030D85AB9
MRILVTGGGGYLGSSLIKKLLDRGDQVTVVDRLIFGQPFVAHPNLRVYRADVRVRQDMEQLLRGQEAIVHLAFVSNDPAYELDPQHADSINIGTLEPLLRLSADAGVSRFVFLSSCSVYGHTSDDCVFEHSPAAPLTDYARHKLICESIIQKQSDAGFSWTILRAATIFGLSSRQRFDLLLNRMLAEALVTKKIILGSPDACRPVVTMGWLVDAIIHVLIGDDARVSRKIFNVATETRTVSGWGEFIQAHFPCDLYTHIADASTDQRSYTVVADRLAESGFHSDRSMVQSLVELAHAILTNVCVNPLTTAAFHNIATQRQHDFSVVRPMERVL